MRDIAVTRIVIIGLTWTAAGSRIRKALRHMRYDIDARRVVELRRGHDRTQEVEAQPNSETRND